MKRDLGAPFAAQKNTEAVPHPGGDGLATLVVGSFVTNPSAARDLDIQVGGYSYDALQRNMKALEGQEFSGLIGGHTFKTVLCSKADEDGRIDPADGNAHVAVWITMNTGVRINISVPHKVTAATQRYNLKFIQMDPTLSIAESALRRTLLIPTELSLR
jgi:hypothetical protein